MALHDLAQRSGFTHAVDNVVFLQLELPSSRPELRELFSCQVEIDDYPITPVEENEWRKSEFAIRLNERVGAEQGTVGVVTISDVDRRNVTFDPDQPQRRLLTVFGKESLLKNIYHDGWYRYGYDFNARVRCLSVERQEGRIWLVRGEILSGGIIFGDQRAIATSDRQRIWPNDNLRGIFFTGSELQVEVGPEVGTIQNHQLHFEQAPNTPRTLKINSQLSDGSEYLFRARSFDNPNWGEWHTIESWDGRNVELNPGYSEQTKPQRWWHYQIIDRAKQPRRFRLLGVTRSTDTGAVQRAVWEQISATSALSQLLGEPPVLPIDPPDTTGIRYFRSAETLGSSLGIKITKETKSASRAIVVVDDMDRTSSKQREFLRIDWRLEFDNRLGGISWSPQTLLIHSAGSNNAQYEFIDRNEAQSVLNAATSTSADNRVQRLTFSGTLDTSTKFKLRFKDDVSGFINWSSKTGSLQQNVQDALNAMPTIGEGNTVVSQSKSPTITFLNASANADIPLLVVESVSAGANVTIESLAAQVQFKWNRNDDVIQPTIPVTRLIGTALDARTSTDESSDKSREIWFQASCASSTPYAGLPPGWANITAQQPPAVPLGNGASVSGLNGPIVYKTADEWSMEAAPADPETGRATVTPGVRLTLTQVATTKSAKLELFAADVTLDSPPFRIYDKPINEPIFVPNERRPQNETAETCLRFIHRPEWERVPPENDNSVMCVHEDGNFVLRRTPQAIRLFLPAERALIDPVSVTRGNLVGRQIVAFPLLFRPTDASKFLNLSAAQPSVDSQGTPIVTLSLELADEEFPDDEKDKMRGFFAQLEPKNALFPILVARILKLERDGLDRKKAKLEVTTDRTITPGEYRLTVGPTRLALSRDVNHGLIPIGVSEFQITAPKSFARLSFAADKIRGEEGQSVLALHPWSEWGPSPTDKPWLTTGRVRLHHRNLIQEHAEFESSFEDRFPPEGPAKNPDGSVPSPLLPLADFVRAVRDRYTEATGNLIAPSDAPPTKGVRNWLPNSKLASDAGQTLNPQVEIALNASDLTELPEAKVKTELGIADDPFSFKVKANGDEQHFYQSLKLRKATEPGADQHWLDVSVRPSKLEIAKKPELRLAKTDPTDVTSRRAVDSSVPLLFSRHDICALATIGLDDGRCLAIVGSPEQSAKSFLFAEDGSISQIHDFPGDALVDVALLHHSGTVRGLAIRKTGSDVELIRFTVNSSTGAVDNPPTTISTASIGTPHSLACPPQEPSASVLFFLLTDKPAVFQIQADTGVVSEIIGTGAKATAIGVDRALGVHYLAVGTSDGTMSVWHNSSGTWSKLTEGNERDEDSPILGKAGQKVSNLAKKKDLAARPIRALCVLGDATRPIVVALDGTRFPCVWGTDPEDGTDGRVWLQTSDASNVFFGRVLDLEQRGAELKLTNRAVRKLIQSGVPAEAFHSLQSMQDKNFPSRMEFEHTLRELIDEVYEVHVQTILEHVWIDSAVPLFTVGLRSGFVRVCAALADGTKTELTNIRQFDTAETPVTRLNLACGSHANRPAVCLVGTSAGGLLAWDARSGMEWGEAERITPTTFLDALGVVRAVPALPVAADLIVDKLSIKTVEYKSISTRRWDLVVDQPSGTAAEGITDIRLWADSFKVRADGSVEPKQFPDGPFDPGHFAFYSEIVAAPNQDPKLASLATFDRLPRLAGVPFFVTAVKELKVTGDLTGIESVKVEGVLINPDEVGAGQDPADVGTLSGVVIRSLSRCAPIVVTITLGNWDVEPESRIDWTFAVNRQDHADVEGVYQGFPGAIARVVGSVSKAMNGRLSIAVAAHDSRALIFERLWPLGESVTILSQASFERTNDKEAWGQTQFSFQSEGDDSEPFLNIPSAMKAVPTASLAVDFGNVQVNAASITGRLEKSRRVKIKLGSDDAHAQLEQGGYRCLLLDPTECDTDDEACKVKRGKRALILWTSGDLAGVGFDPTIGPLKLCAALVRMDVKREQEPTPLTFINSSGGEIGKCSANVHQSQMKVEVNSDGTSKPVAMFGTVLIKADLKEQTLWLLFEGNVQSPDTELSGLLALGVRNEDNSPANEDNAHAPKLQATVRAKVNLDPRTGQLTVQLIDDVFWAAFVEPFPGTSEPEICLTRPSGITESTAFSVNGFTDKPVTPKGFVRIGLSKDADGKLELGIQTVAASSLPLLPELEPTLVQTPELLGNNEVRLSHRLRAGLALRPNIPLDPFDAVLDGSTSGQLKSPTATDQELLLETVVSTAGPLVRLRPEGWLVPSKTSNKYRTEGLFVLNVDFRPDDIPVVAAIEARTRKRDDDEPVPAERDRYRELLRAAGAQGVAISYHLTDEAMADLGFVDSPFYDHPGEVGPNRTVAADESVVSLARTAFIHTTPTASPAWVYGFDPCLRLPAAFNDRLESDETSRYVVTDLPSDPYAGICCLGHRQYRLERQRSTTNPEEFDNAETPILHNAEVPAFRQPARLSFPLTGHWMRTNVDVDSPIAASRPFFPPRMDWELAADKPGAMFQSLVQARVTNRDGESRREPLIDFALREPQFIRLANCVNAEVYWQKETSISNPENDFADVDLIWTEVIGSVQVDDMDEGDWLEPTITGIALKRTPLQLVIDFNSEVFLVNQVDAAVPAYRVEAQSDEGVPPVKVLPAATYLVANPNVDTVFKPQTVTEEQERHCTITDEAGVWKATFTDNGPLPPSGTTFTLTNVAHRFVRPHGQHYFELMQDTATEDGDPDAFPIKIGTEDKNVKVLCRRPLCIELDVDDPNPLNGATTTSNVEIRRIRDGVAVTHLRLAQVATGEKKYLIVTPSNTVEGETCRVVRTQADGFLEAAVRFPAKVTRDKSKAWTPGLTLTEPADLSELQNRLSGSRLIRLGATKAPEANGVFKLFNNALARASVGNGYLAGPGGSADAFFNSDPISIVSVDGKNTPIIIELDRDPGAITHPWQDGLTPIAVAGVTGVPQANGTWIVQRINARQYALYEPTSTEAGDDIDGVVSALVPLREAFVEVRDQDGNLIPRLGRLELDPKWEATDRPLLQIHWVGAAQFANEDGKGIAWRPGGVMVGMYEQIKQVKFLANSQLSPKLAFVMTAPEGTSWQRTILFGDSAPPFKAEPTIEPVKIDDITTMHFFLKIPNNRESLSVPVPQGINSDDFVLHLVKSLPSGVAIYDRYPKESD